MLAFGAMSWRLIGLQIFDAPAFAQLAANQREREIPFSARRGTIFDRDGEPLAISVDLPTIFTDPKLVEDPVAEAAALAPLVDVPRDELEAKLASPTRFQYIARQVQPEVARKVRALDLAGIYTRQEAKRYYPNSSLASQSLGFVDVDGRGLSGIELLYEELLRGEPGLMTLEQDPEGVQLPQAEFTYKSPEPGRSLFLTIDKDLQYFTELTLQRAVSRYHADGGSAIVMRVGTGEILALANSPTFDLNRAGDASEEARRNRAVASVYEPGSAFKIVTLAAGLQTGSVRPRTKFSVPDTLAYEGHFFHDSHGHATEEMTVAEIIQQSSNVGTIKIGLQVGGKLLDRFIRRFGFGAETGLGFPTETTGIVLDRADWSGITIANLPIGQGIAVTALQMAGAYQTIANDGKWVEPKLVMSTLQPGGKVESASAPSTRRVISKTTAREMTDILSGVVEEGGTGTLAAIPGYAVAGKTGTAQKALPTGGYGNSYTASFAGFAPAHRPEVVVLVVLDEPSPIWGGHTAAPTFRTIMEFTLRHLGVAPTGNAEKAAREIEEASNAQTPALD